MQRPAVVLGLVLALGGCGDNLPGDRFAPRGGTRLALEWLVYADGARQPAGIFDRELGTSCEITRWSDGLAYCTPPAGGVVFTDAACTQPIAAVARGESSVVHYLLETFTVADQPRPSRLYRIGAELPPPTEIYEPIGGGCLSTDPARYTFYARGAEIPRATLARVKRSEPLGTGRLRVTVDASDDGLQLPATIVDDELGSECVAEPRSAAPTARCVPPSVDITFFRDPACAVPVVAVPRDLAMPMVARLADDETGCTSYAAVGDELAAPALYRRAGASCQTALAPPDYRMFAVGAPLELATLERVPVPVSGDDRRLWNVELVHGDARMQVPAMFDRELDTECEPVAVGDATYCLPWSPISTIAAYFSEGSCSIPIDVALMPRGTCDPRSRYVRYATAEGPVVRVLGPRYLGTLHEISTADVCLEHVPPPRLKPFTLADRVEGFPAAIRERE